MKTEDAVTDDFEEHFAENSGGYLDPTLTSEVVHDPSHWPASLKALSFVDPNVISTLAENAPPTLAWLTGFGVRFQQLEVPFPTSRQPRWAPSGGGLALIEALAKRFEDSGGNIVYETAAQSLIQDAGNHVIGVRAVGPGNRPVEFHGSAVVLGCGGFQGNAEMLTRYIGPRALYLRTMSVGCHANKGEGIRMALEIGAAPCGDFGSWHASPADPRSNRPGPSMYVYPYGVLVNLNGQRFVDEGPGHTDATYESVTREIYAQPKGIAYVILDAGLQDVPNLSVAIRTEQPAIEAPTLAELAVKLDIAPEVLERTISEYNAACRPGEFDPRALDGLRTEGLTPRKSNWARPIARALQGLPDHLDHCVHVRRLEGQHAGPGPQHAGRGDPGTVCGGRDDGDLLRNLYGRDLGHEGRGVRTDRRIGRCQSPGLGQRRLRPLTGGHHGASHRRAGKVDRRDHGDGSGVRPIRVGGRRVVSGSADQAHHSVPAWRLD